MSEIEADFEKIMSRLDIDDGPNPLHQENLRRQMLSAYNEAGEQQKPKLALFENIRRTVMKSPITQFSAAAAVVIGVIIGMHYLIPGASGGLVPIDFELPRPMFVGTPQDTKVPNLEEPLGKPRPAFLAPPGTKNVAFEKPVTSTDDFPIIGELEMITDGDKEAADGSYVELGPLKQSVTIDLEAEYNIYAILVWHFHKQARVYFDVIVQVSSDADFVEATTLYSNDIDNSSGAGVGEDKHYTETNEGRLIDAKGIEARYVRLYSNGNNYNDLNHYIEVEVYGTPVE